MAAVAMAADALGGLAGRRVLVVGAGDMGEGMAVALADCRCRPRCSSRTAPSIAPITSPTRLGGRPVRLLELADALAEVDVLLTSTGARSILVEHADLAPVMAARPSRPLLVVDVAVPRDVDPGVASIPGVTLLDIDDLRAFADRGLAGASQRDPCSAGASSTTRSTRWIDHSTAREVAPLVAAMREWADGVREGELERAKTRLEASSRREREAVEAITRGIVAKLLHEPTVRSKEVAGTPRGERLAEALRDLFAL